MGNIVGIDLGTTNSVAAFKFADAEVVTAPDNTPPDRKLTRSVVALKDNQIVVGQDAYFQLKADPENVIISIKRLIGRGFGDSVVQQQLDRFAYKITKSSKGTENSLSVWLGGKEYEPEDISAEILKKVVHNAQTYQEQQGQRETITKAVITIPAYFNDKQRHATQIAATRAGRGKPKKFDGKEGTDLSVYPSGKVKVQLKEDPMVFVSVAPVEHRESKGKGRD